MFSQTDSLPSLDDYVFGDSLSQQSSSEIDFFGNGFTQGHTHTFKTNVGKTIDKPRTSTLCFSQKSKTNLLGKSIGAVNNSQYYIASLSQLANHKGIQLWEGQRSLDHERVEEIAKAFLMQYQKTGKILLRGSIILCKNDTATNDNLYLIDGQHRYHSLLLLFKKGLVKDLEILIELVIVQFDKDIRNEFININKSVPVPNHYLNPNDIVTGCCQLLMKKFPKAFSSGKPRRPTINIDSFKDCLLDKSQLLAKLEITDSEQLYDAVMNLNNHYSSLGKLELQNKIARNNQNERRIVSNCFDKCRKGDYLFLGLFKDTNWAIDLFNI